MIEAECENDTYLLQWAKSHERNGGDENSAALAVHYAIDGVEKQVLESLMTVQCGGIGLNLTAASHAIHFDRCYNPAKEAQATDRCHRLGQHRTVCVHRVVTEGTYEERLEEIMQRKQDLSSLTVTHAEDWIADYDDDALFDLFMLRSGSNTTSRDSVGNHGSSVRASPLSKALSTYTYIVHLYTIFL